MLATLAPSLPIGDKWSYEIKWDGYRAMLVKGSSGVKLLSRNLKNLTADFPVLPKAAARLTPYPAVLDGEIVALDAQGVPSFQALQHRATKGLAIVFYAFDLLQLGSTDFRRQPLSARRRALHQLAFAGPILLSEPLPGSPDQIEAAVRTAGLEGVVAKRVDSIYEAGKRSDAWIKVKFNRRQEFVVAGYKPAGAGFDSILVGFYEGRRLLFAGKVRAGFIGYTRSEVFDRIRRSEVATCPFANLPNSTGRSHWGEGITAEDMTSLRWVSPRVVVEVAFTEWTAGGSLRHASFVSIRDDKPPRDVRRT
jgi:bifunctional non-homologous end joining protein LigD